MCARIAKKRRVWKWNASRLLRWNKKWWRAIRSNYDPPVWTGRDVIGTRVSSIGGRSESGPGLMRQRAVI